MMNQTVWTAIVPGKIMLAGEYAVLYGMPALAVTVNHTLKLQASFNADNHFWLNSNLWPSGRSLSYLELREQENSDNLLLRALAHAAVTYNLDALTVEIDSNLHPSYGIGSSSALLLALYFAIAQLTRRNADQWQIAKYAYDIQKQLQEKASGYDIITQLLGGTVLVTPLSTRPTKWPPAVEQVATDYSKLNDHIVIYVGGKGSNTKQTMIDTVNWLEQKNLTKELMKLSYQLTLSFLQFIKFGNATDGYLSKLIDANKNHRQIFYQSPHYPRHIFRALDQVAGCDQSWSYKMTGAGGEDAILLIGTSNTLQNARLAMEQLNWHQAPFRFQDLSLKSFEN